MKALFLDRDGVINVHRGYVYKQEDFEFIPGVFEVCRFAKQLGYLIFVVTNQGGIGRGYYTTQDFIKLTLWMLRGFEAQGVNIDKVYFCPDVSSPNRKPAPGMILQAAKDFGVDLSSSIMVGDNETDIQAGIAAGVGTNLLIRRNYGKKEGMENGL